MRVRVILLDYLRHDHTENALRTNTLRAKYPFDLIKIDMKGLSAAFNEGLKDSLDYDAVVFMANDIELPERWLADMVHYATHIPNTGTIGFHTVESLPNPKEVNGLKIWEVLCAFGDTLITKQAIDKVGFFNTDFDPYGTQDYDYSWRVSKVGLLNYYIPGEAIHVGHDVGNGTEYRKMKDESLARAHAKANHWFQWYEKNGVYLPYDQEEVIINKNQFYGEA